MVNNQPSLLTPSQISQRVVKIAESYIGLTEKKANSGFNSEDFEKKMRAIGWRPGEAWCAYLVELIYREAFTDQPKLLPSIAKLFTPSAVGTWSNLVNSKMFKTSTTTPVPGAAVFWRHGNGWSGHAGVVIATDLGNNRFVATEGNTNDQGGREGYIVAHRPRKLELPHTDTGLNLLGFVYPYS